MNWPEDLEAVTCVGFSESLLPILMNAVDADHVTWVVKIVSAKTSDGRYSEFDYLGFRYALDELYEAVSTPTGEDWGFVPVRVEKIAKVDTDDNGNTIVVESYPITTPQAAVQKYAGAWATF